MSFPRSFAALVILASLIAPAIVTNTKCPDPFPPNPDVNCAAILCSTEPDPLYASTNGGRTCLFQTNPCQLQVLNCFRHQRNDERLSPIEKKYCQNTCPVACTRELKPICGAAGNERRTFANECLFKQENCIANKKQWTIVSRQACPDDSSEKPHIECPNLLCDNNYNPVYGSTNGGQTCVRFRNSCLLQEASCSRHRNGDAGFRVLPRRRCRRRCNTICTEEFAPVCGVANHERRTFSNECEFRKEQCISRKNWSLLKRSRCEDDEPQNCLTLRCSNIQDPVFGTKTGGATCLEFANDCQRILANCDARRNGEKVFTRIPRKQCGQLCSNICPTVFSPVCGTNGRETRTFSNECGFNSHKCINGKEWRIIRNGPCQWASG